MKKPVKDSSVINLDDFLESNDYFNSISKKDKDFLKKNAAIIHYAKKETIFKQGAYAANVIFIIDGMVKLIMEGENGRKLVTRISCSNDFIGLTDIYGSSNYDFSAYVMKETSILQIRTDVFKQLIARNNKFALDIFKWYCEHTELIYQKVFTLGTKQMHGRLADVVIELCSDKFKDENIFKSVTRKDMAEMAGMSMESAIRLLGEFKNDGLITVDGKKITINNLTLLERLSRIG